MVGTTAESDCKQCRYEFIDLIKFMAMAMVMVLHVPALRTEHVAQFALRLAFEPVPLFVMVNGFLLFRPHARMDLRKHKYKTFVLALTLLIWTALWILFRYPLESPETGPLTIRTFLQFFFTSPNGGHTRGLWFLISLIGIYLLYPVIFHIHKTNSRVFSWFVWVVGFFAVAPHVIGSVASLLAAITGKELRILFSIQGYVAQFNPVGFTTFLFHFLMGALAADQMVALDDGKVRRRLVLAGVAAYLASLAYCLALSWFSKAPAQNGFNYSSPLYMIAMVGVFAALYPYRGANKIIYALVSSISGNTLEIYLIQGIVTTVIERYIEFDGMPFVLRLSVAMLALVCCWAMSIPVKRLGGTLLGLPLVRGAIDKVL